MAPERGEVGQLDLGLSLAASQLYCSGSGPLDSVSSSKNIEKKNTTNPNFTGSFTGDAGGLYRAWSGYQQGASETQCPQSGYCVGTCCLILFPGVGFLFQNFDLQTFQKVNPWLNENQTELDSNDQCCVRGLVKPIRIEELKVWLCHFLVVCLEVNYTPFLCSGSSSVK